MCFHYHSLHFLTNSVTVNIQCLVCLGVMFGEMMLSRNCSFIHSRTFEEHLFKMFLLFKKIPTKNDLYEMCLDHPCFKVSNNNNKEQIKLSYSDYLYEKLTTSFSIYFRNDTDETKNQVPWFLDIPFKYHSNVCYTRKLLNV